jgi:hypothetical protein
VIRLRHVVQHHVVFKRGDHLADVANQPAINREGTIREGFLQVCDALKHEPEAFLQRCAFMIEYRRTRSTRRT